MPSLSRHYFSTLATNGINLLVGTAGAILAARLLGPTGRGELAAIFLWPAAVVTILGSLGLHDAGTFFAARHPNRLNALFTALQLLGAAQTLFFGAVAYSLLPWVLAGQRPEVVWLARLFLLFLPVGFNSLYLLSLLQGRLQIRQYNVARLLTPAWYATLLLGLYWWGRVSLPWVVGGQLVGHGLTAVLLVYFVRQRLHLRWDWDPTIFGPLLRYGLKVHFSLAASYINLRLDQLVMSVLLPPAALGYYVVAVAMAEPVQSISYAIGGVTLAAAAQEDLAGAQRIIGHSLRTVGLMLLVSVVPLFFLVSYLVPLFLGAAFTPAVPACRVLLLAGVPLAFIHILHYSFRALDKPQIPGYAALVGNGVTVILLAWLLPRFGFLGAAYASLGAYSATLIFLLWYMRSRLGLSWRKLMNTGGREAKPLVSPKHFPSLEDQVQP